MTVEDILNYVDRKFPNQENTANKIIDLNKNYSELFVVLKRLTNTYGLDETDVTVANQEEYDLPTGVRIEDILKLEVETYNGSGEFEEFVYAGLKDDISYEKVFMRGSTVSKYYLYDDEEALTTADRIIKVYYNVRPITFSADNLSAIPNIDEEYHSLLCYALIVELSSQGNNPYRDVANYYQQKYDEFMREVMRDIEDRATANGRLYIKEQKERW